MAKAYKRLRRQRTQRRLKNQSFMEPSKRPLQGRRKKSFIRSLLARLDRADTQWQGASAGGHNDGTFGTPPGRSDGG
jgi:hypothetical protein